MVCENETLFIFAPCYGSITVQRYEIITKIGNKPISKIENFTIWHSLKISTATSRHARWLS